MEVKFSYFKKHLKEFLTSTSSEEVRIVDRKGNLIATFVSPLSDPETLAEDTKKAE